MDLHVKFKHFWEEIIKQLFGYMFDWYLIYVTVEAHVFDYC